ncbi:hypothetical protein EON65_02415 [archaeon]|nr:MAG: hypothetical protein EON65_02415 [archaeon]
MRLFEDRKLLAVDQTFVETLRIPDMERQKFVVLCTCRFQENWKATACDIHEQIAQRIVSTPDFLTLIEVDVGNN